jgi:hypothetical protein
MRWILPALLLAGCAGARSTPARQAGDRAPTTATTTKVQVAMHTMVARDREPTGDTLLDEYLATTGRATHEVMPLAGEVTCYGGPALDGDMPVELYVRRGVDRTAATVVEDIVALHPDDLVPRRELVTFSAAPGVNNVRDGDGYTIGRVLVEDADRYVLIVRNWSLGVEVTGHAADAAALRHVAYVIEPKHAERAGLEISTLNEPEDFATAQPKVLDLAADNATMSVKGELEAIAPERCAEVFAHFPPR